MQLCAHLRRPVSWGPRDLEGTLISSKDLTFLKNHTIDLLVNLFSKSLLNIHGLNNLKVLAFPMQDIDLKVAAEFTKETVTLFPENIVGLFREVDAVIETGSGVLLYCFDRFTQCYSLCACYLMYR
jgi:hypothetical protein